MIKTYKDATKNNQLIEFENDIYIIFFVANETKHTLFCYYFVVPDRLPSYPVTSPILHFGLLIFNKLSIFFLYV